MPAVTAYQRLADELRDEILDGDMVPGDRLPNEGDLTERFSVSRSTVREALRVLTSQGFVVTTRGVKGGTFVAQPLPSDVGDSLIDSLQWLTLGDRITVAEMLEARELLEVPACGLAAQRRSAKDLSEMESALARPDEDSSLSFESSRDFHVRIVQSSGNELLETMTRPIFVVLQDRFLRDRAPSEFWSQVAEEHQRIYQGIAAGDRLTAEYEMREHLRHLRVVYEQLDRLRDAD